MQAVVKVFQKALKDVSLLMCRHIQYTIHVHILNNLKLSRPICKMITVISLSIVSVCIKGSLGVIDAQNCTLTSKY